VACNKDSESLLLRGIVRSGSGAALAGYNVSLYASLVDRAEGWQLVAAGTTDASGRFDMFYDAPAERSVLFAVAERGPVMLASAIGYGSEAPATFNSLANAVAACVAADAACTSLFNAAKPPGGTAPDNVLQAIANIVKYPSYPGYPNDQLDPVFKLSTLNAVYKPALASRPTSWLSPPQGFTQGSVSWPQGISSDARATSGSRAAATIP
jgi:hypothetical protein